MLHLTEGTVKGYVSKVLANLKLTDEQAGCSRCGWRGRGGRRRPPFALGFDRFVLDPVAGRLARSVGAVPLTPKASAL